MHVSGKKMAFSGLMLALTVVLMVLSGVFQFNTLFLLGAASFFFFFHDPRILNKAGRRLLHRRSNSGTIDSTG